MAFDLREGVTFSDGTPFDSTAAEWNLKRWMGVSDFSWIGISDAFDSIVTDGPNKLTVKLERPVPAALLELTIVRPVRFLSPKAVDKDGKQTAPIGTGPWIVEKYDSSGTSLVRNDKYWGEKPLFSRMELKVVPDELARANGLRSDTGPAAKPDPAGTGLPVCRALRIGRSRLPAAPAAVADDIRVDKPAPRGLPGRAETRGDRRPCLMPQRSRSGD
ncbi:ABC transporter substrate-binding protein [Mesorhizobium sp. M0136]